MLLRERERERERVFYVKCLVRVQTEEKIDINQKDWTTSSET